MSAVEVTQKRFDQISAFDRSARGCTSDGAAFTTTFAELVPCDCVDENSIVITIALPPSTGSDLVSSCGDKVNGDYVEACVIALWRLVNADDIATEGSTVRLILLGLSATVFSAQQLSPDEVEYMRALEHEREVSIKVPPSFLVVRMTAVEARKHILTTAAQGWQLEFQEQSSTIPNAIDSQLALRTSSEQELVDETKKRSRSVAGESPDYPDSNKKLSADNVITQPATNTSTKLIQGMDGNMFAVSDAKAASKQFERLALAIRMAESARYPAFGITRSFELKPEVLFDSIEHYAHRVRQLTDSEKHWESTGGLSYMQRAAVFSDRDMFERAITGQFDWRRVYALSLKSFHMDGPQAMYVDTGEKASTSFFRVQVSHCLEGYERFLRVVFCLSYEGVMLQTTCSKPRWGSSACEFQRIAGCSKLSTQILVCLRHLEDSSLWGGLFM